MVFPSGLCGGKGVSGLWDELASEKALVEPDS